MRVQVARSLIERGAPVNCKKTTNGFTPLHQAAIIGEEALAKMLIDKGAETEVIDREQMTPLHRFVPMSKDSSLSIIANSTL